MAQVTEDFSKDSLIQENRSLKDEVMLLKSVVIRMDQQMSNMKSQIVDLKRRSMRNNILIHSYEHNANENYIADVPKAINENLGVDVEFVRVHRNGPARPDGKPVTITGKLASLDDKEKILAAQKDKRGKKVKLPFSITAQEPIPLVEERKKLYEISDSYRNRQIMSKVERGAEWSYRRAKFTRIRYQNSQIPIFWRRLPIISNLQRVCAQRLPIRTEGDPIFEWTVQKSSATMTLKMRI